MANRALGADRYPRGGAAAGWEESDCSYGSRAISW